MRLRYDHTHICIGSWVSLLICAFQYWKKNLPTAIEKNQVEFVGHDFFEPQPKLFKPADVFLLRFIVHDWSDKYAIKILRHLREAATMDTKLVVIDVIVSHTCKSDTGSVNPKISAPPAPLLQNWGEANIQIQNISVAVSLLLASLSIRLTGYTRS